MRGKAAGRWVAEDDGEVQDHVVHQVSGRSGVLRKGQRQRPLVGPEQNGAKDLAQAGGHEPQLPLAGLVVVEELQEPH